MNTYFQSLLQPEKERRETRLPLTIGRIRISKLEKHLYFKCPSGLGFSLHFETINLKEESVIDEENKRYFDRLPIFSGRNLLYRMIRPKVTNNLRFLPS
jgi:hypothetical protein